MVVLAPQHHAASLPDHADRGLVCASDADQVRCLSQSDRRQGKDERMGSPVHAPYYRPISESRKVRYNKVMQPRILKDTLVHDGAYLQFVERLYQDRQGHKRKWEMIRRKTHGPVVAIAAVTRRKELVLVKEFRPPMSGYVLETPAGLMDRRGESPLQVARRELLEETGYTADRFELLGRGPFTAGLTPEEIAVYLAYPAKRVSAPKLDGSEDIEVVLVPLRKLFSFLNKKHSHLRVDIKIAALIPYLEKRGLV